MTTEEYNKCVDLYADHVFRFILKNIKDTMKAEDVVQDAFERLWGKFDGISFEKAKAYLFAAAYHIMIDVLRKEKKTTGWDSVYENKNAHDPQYDNLNEILHGALDCLPDSQKSVILLRDYEGYSYQEISEITGLSESQVKVYIYRGRLFLRNFLVKHKISVL